MRVEAREMIVEFAIISDDRGHRGGSHLFVIAGRDAGQEPLLAGRAAHQNEPHRLAIAAGRPELRQNERGFDGAFRDQAILPSGKGSRLVEQCRKRLCGDRRHAGSASARLMVLGGICWPNFSMPDVRSMQMTKSSKVS